MNFWTSCTLLVIFKLCNFLSSFCLLSICVYFIIIIMLHIPSILFAENWMKFMPLPEKGTRRTCLSALRVVFLWMWKVGSQCDKSILVKFSCGVLMLICLIHWYLLCLWFLINNQLRGWVNFHWTKMILDDSLAFIPRRKIIGWRTERMFRVVECDDPGASWMMSTWNL